MYQASFQHNTTYELWTFLEALTERKNTYLLKSRLFMLISSGVQILHTAPPTSGSCSELPLVPPRQGAVRRVESTAADWSLNTFPTSRLGPVPLLCSRWVELRFFLRVCTLFGNLFSNELFLRRAPSWENDGSGTAAFSYEYPMRGGHFACGALRHQAALRTAARAGSSAHHQEKQVKTWEERHIVPPSSKYGKKYFTH